MVRLHVRPQLDRHLPGIEHAVHAVKQELALELHMRHGTADDASDADRRERIDDDLGTRPVITHAHVESTHALVIDR